MTLVVIKCVSCGPDRLLNRVESAPAPHDERRWAGYVFVHTCPRHGEGNGHGDIAAWQRRQLQAGKNTGRRTIGRWVPWSSLRPAVEQARATHRACVAWLSSTGDVLKS